MVMIDVLVSTVQQTLWVLYEGGLFILVGFAVAGAVHVLLEPERIVRYLGERSLKAAAIAALLGAPIPLCSCGVLPTAMMLRRKGASREATVSFLVTTPETGIDSIALTLAFFGPIFTLVRPVAAFATGLVTAFFSLRDRSLDGEAGDDPAPLHVHHHVRAEAPEAAPADAPFTIRAQVAGRRAMRFAFVELFDELGFWLVLAIGLTGVLSAILPADFFGRVVPSSFAAMLVMVVLSMPL